MYASFSISNLRSIRKLELPELGRITLFTGKNASGKTTVLEAFFLHAARGQPQQALILNSMRGLFGAVAQFDATKGGEEFWSSLFPYYDTARDLTLSGTWDGELRSMTLRAATDAAARVQIDSPAPSSAAATANGRPLRLQYIDESTRHSLNFTAAGIQVDPPPPPAPFPTLYLPSRSVRDVTAMAEDIQRFGDLQVRKEDQAVEAALRLMEPRIQKLETVQTAFGPVIHADVGESHLIPLALMGDGPSRVFGLAVNLITAKKGLLLVDEVESGIHYSVLRDIWRAISEISRKHGVQVVATTHSRECAQAAYEALSGNLISQGDDFRLIRLERTKDGRTTAFTYDLEAMQGAFEGGLEIR